MELANSYNYSECPEEFNCSVHRDAASFSIGPVPSYASLVSSSLSCLGSVLVVLAFLMLPEIRTGAQKLITLLSIADFFTALGYFIAGINFLHHYRPLQADDGSSRNCGTFVAVCRIQSFITTTSSLCSFLWTMLLAVYFHVVIVNKQAVVFGKKMFALMNIISWGVPLIITVPLLATHHLGYSPLGTSNWCFIRDSQRYPIDRSLLTLLVLVAGKFWEILSYIVVTILYISISISIYRVSFVTYQPIHKHTTLPDHYIEQCTAGANPSMHEFAIFLVQVHYAVGSRWQCSSVCVCVCVYVCMYV